jgi:hypothetical protein
MTRKADRKTEQEADRESGRVRPGSPCREGGDSGGDERFLRATLIVLALVELAAIAAGVWQQWPRH